MLSSLRDSKVARAKQVSGSIFTESEVTKLAERHGVVALQTLYCCDRHPGIYTFDLYRSKGTLGPYHLPVAPRPEEVPLGDCSGKCEEYARPVGTLAELESRLERGIAALERRAEKRRYKGPVDCIIAPQKNS